MIDLKRKENCTGCKACGDICPKGAISFQTDKEGFWYPEVDPSKCVDCHLCEKVCPELNLKIQKKARTFKPEYYAVVIRTCRYVWTVPAAAPFPCWRIRFFKREDMSAAPFIPVIFMFTIF